MDPITDAEVKQWGLAVADLLKEQKLSETEAQLVFKILAERTEALNQIKNIMVLPPVSWVDLLKDVCQKMQGEFGAEGS
jgi:hypothetical protein